jgi:regulator of nucleoside diphosphate kinase
MGALNKVNRNASPLRPPIVLTAEDREQLSALLETASGGAAAAARFLREEIDRADVIRDPAATSLVQMGSEVRFVDHQAGIREVRLVYPSEADTDFKLSILTALGSALIGLGPGQTIAWLDHAVERTLTVLEVRQPPGEWVQTRRSLLYR